MVLMLGQKLKVFKAPKGAGLGPFSEVGSFTSGLHKGKVTVHRAIPKRKHKFYVAKGRMPGMSALLPVSHYKPLKQKFSTFLGPKKLTVGYVERTPGFRSNLLGSRKKVF